MQAIERSVANLDVIHSADGSADGDQIPLAFTSREIDL